MKSLISSVLSKTITKMACFYTFLFLLSVNYPYTRWEKFMSPQNLTSTAFWRTAHLPFYPIACDYIIPYASKTKIPQFVFRIDVPIKNRKTAFSLYKTPYEFHSLNSSIFTSIWSMTYMRFILSYTSCLGDFGANTT